MPQGHGYTTAMICKMQRYEQQAHAEMLSEARRPASVLTEAHLEWLREQMVLQNRWQHGMNNFKTRWAQHEDE